VRKRTGKQGVTLHKTKQLNSKSGSLFAKLVLMRQKLRIKLHYVKRLGAASLWMPERYELSKLKAYSEDEPAP